MKRTFSQKQTKKNIQNLAIWKKLTFSWCSWSFRFSLILDQWKVTPFFCCCPFSTLLVFSARKCCIVEKQSFRGVLWKGVLRNFAKFIGARFIIKQNLTQVLSCEFCEISKTAFSYRTPLVAASSYHLYCNSKYYHSSWEAYLEPYQISIVELFWGNS